jgi:hypothetical protein
MKFIGEMSDDWKHLLDAWSIGIMSLLGIRKIATSIDAISVVPGWREIALDYILFASAVCTFIWLFFRAVDVIYEKCKAAYKFIKDATKP